MSTALKTASQFVLRHGRWFILLLAALTRFVGLGHPKALVFDETYYVKDAYTLSKLGYEGSWPAEANDSFVAGKVDIFNTDASFVVHPPLGKWLIALGQQLFGAQNSFSWRVAVALAGVLGVWLIMLVAKRLMGEKWALLAGLFMTIDGLAIVMSRTAILDNFVMLFALLAFYFLLLDRERTTTELAFRAATDETKPIVWNRPWLVACAVALGLTTSIKWSGIYFAVAFGVYIIFSETLTRRRLGLKHAASDGLIGQTQANLLLMVPAYIGTYLLTWTGWIVTRGGWERNWAQDPNNLTGPNALPSPLNLLPHWLQSLIHFHESIYSFHVNLKTPHNYQSNAFMWLFNIRPVSFYYQGLDANTPGCASNYNCAEAITALGNPLIWWGAAAAVILVLIRYIAGFARLTDPRGEHYLKPLDATHRVEGLLLLGLVGGYIPWMFYLQRTVFSFYAIAFLPWMLLCLVYVLKLISDSPGWARAVRIFVWLCVIFSVFYSNIWFGYQTPYWYWMIHMWLPSWI